MYLVRTSGSQNPRRQRVFVVVSRQVLIDSKFSTLVCAAVYSRHDGLSTQVRVGVEDGLKKESSIHCDELFSLPKALLTRYVGRLGVSRIGELNRALATALELEEQVFGY